MDPKTQCWECARRQVTCDGTPLACETCRASGIVCPGYENRKPLTWLTPGKVKSRTWKKKAAKPRQKKPDRSPADAEKARLALVIRTPVIREPAQGSLFVSGMGHITEQYHMFEAAQYYNATVCPQMARHFLGPGPFGAPFPDISSTHDLLGHLFVSAVLVHRIHSQEETTDKTALRSMWTRLYHYRGLSIRYLSEAMAEPTAHDPGAVITATLMLIYVELQHSLSSSWQTCLRGAMALIHGAGGIATLFTQNPGFRPLLQFFALIEIIGNTTSPANKQSISFSTPDTIDLMWRAHSWHCYPRSPCPVPLLFNIVSINRLRATGLDRSISPSLRRSAADDIHADILKFSTEQFANKDSIMFPERLLVAQIYQSAAALYCIASLQDLGDDPRLHSRRCAHASELVSYLEKAQAVQEIRSAVFWPLVVAGMESKSNQIIPRAFITQQLAQMSRDLGSALPRLAGKVLERFWASSKASWDDCFNQPYCFVS